MADKGICRDECAAALETAAAWARKAHVTGVMLAGTVALHGMQGSVRGASANALQRAAAFAKIAKHRIVLARIDALHGS